jgi:hypothetical protein
MPLTGKGFAVLRLDSYSLGAPERRITAVGLQTKSSSAANLVVRAERMALRRKPHISRRPISSATVSDGDGASRVRRHTPRIALPTIRLVTEVNGSGLACGTTPDRASHVIAQWKLWKKEVHLRGITTEATILYEFNDQHIPDGDCDAIGSRNLNSNGSHKTLSPWIH